MGKKILICCNVYPPGFVGGAELIAHSQAKELMCTGFDVTVFTGDISEIGKRHSLRREEYEGLPVYRVRLTAEDFDPRCENFTHKEVEEHFRTVLKKISPEIVHFHNLVGLSVGLIHIAKKQGIKTVLTLHDYWGFCFKNTLLKNNDELCRDFTRCPGCREVIPGQDNRNIPMRMRQDFIAMQLEEIDAFISPSQYLADQYVIAGLPREKIQVIWNGVDVEKFSKVAKVPDPDHIRFTFIGYFGTHKGIDILLDALEYLGHTQDFAINLIGDGELFSWYADKSREKKLEVVKFWGKIPNIEEAYAHTDVFVLPSIWPENQPVTITEAMSAGIPVIASDCGGIPELIENGKTGFLFAPGNSMDLAAKMDELIHNPGEMKLFGDAGYNKIKNFTIQTQVQKIIDLYNRIPGKRSNDAPRPPLIVCHGKRVDPACAAAIGLSSKNVIPRNILFLMFDWLSDDQIRDGALLWIVNECEDISALHSCLRYALPLLVPEKKKEFQTICEKLHGCMLYRDCLDAGDVINFIVQNEKEWRMMMKNGTKARDFFPKKFV